VATPRRCSISIEKTATSREGQPLCGCPLPTQWQGGKRCLSSLLAQRGVLRLGHDGEPSAGGGTANGGLFDLRPCGHSGVDAAWHIRQRKVVLDQNVLLAKNLTFFF